MPLTLRHGLLPGLLLLSAAAVAAPCLYSGEDAEARVINRSGEIYTPHPTALTALDCNRLRVVSGSVLVYVLGADGAVGQPKRVSNGVLVAAGAGGGPGGADTLGILKEIAVVLQGVSRTKNGSSRGAEGDYLVKALPSDKLAEPTTDVVIALGPVPDQNLRLFELKSNGKTSYRQAGPAQSLKLPAAVLKAGSKHSWHMEYSGTSYDGQFVVEPAAATAELKRTLAQELAGESDETYVRLHVAEGLARAGYTWDARELIAAAMAR
jgi:hypothetical protein